MGMRELAVLSLKGGTGKSTVTARLGLALRDKGFKVGFLDLDIHGPNLHLALGLDSPPSLGLDTEREMIIPPNINGYKLVTMASHFGEGWRILWRGEDKLD